MNRKIRTAIAALAAIAALSTISVTSVASAARPITDTEAVLTGGSNVYLQVGATGDGADEQTCEDMGTLINSAIDAATADGASPDEVRLEIYVANELEDDALDMGCFIVW